MKKPDQLKKFMAEAQDIAVRLLLIQSTIIGAGLAFDGKVGEPKFMGILTIVLVILVIGLSNAAEEEKKDAEPSDRKSN